MMTTCSENRPEACEAESENGSTNAVQLGQVNDFMDGKSFKELMDEFRFAD